MAKKRRYKKSVKRGCALLLALLVAGVWLGVRGCGRKTDGACRQAPEARAEARKRPAPNPAVREALLRLKEEPQRLDTSRVALMVYDLTARQPVMEWNSRRLIVPASTLKLLTAITALQRLGVGHRYVSSVSVRGEVSQGTLYGTALLQTDDDPLLESLAPLVDALHGAGIRRVEGALLLDMLRDDTLQAHPTAARWDIPYHRLPLLLKGRPHVERELRHLLARRGIEVRQNPLLTPQGLLDDRASASYRLALGAYLSEARRLYAHTTPLTDVVTPMLVHSSNIKADALFHHLDHLYAPLLGPHKPEQRLVDRFIDEDMKYKEEERAAFVINDGSGLSPENRVTTHFLTELLAYAWRQRDIRRVLVRQSLATPGVPGRRGSLLTRLAGETFRGRVFCKTGTLTTRGASSLAGYAKGRDGHWYAFCVVNEESPVAEGRIYQDKVCRILVQ